MPVTAASNSVKNPRRRLRLRLRYFSIVFLVFPGIFTTSPRSEYEKCGFGYAGLAAFGHPLLDRDASRTSRERRIGSSLSRRSSMSVTDVSRCISQSEGGSSRARFLNFSGKPLPQLYPHLDSSGSLSSRLGYLGYAGLAAFGHPLLNRDVTQTSRERRIGSSLSRRSSVSVADLSRRSSLSEADL